MTIETILETFFILMIVSSFLSSIYLLLAPIPIQYVIGNPRPVYFYDTVSCDEQNIRNNLDYITQQTGVKFIELWYPLASWTGGIGYKCNDFSGYNVGANGAYTSGEAESGVWNKIKLYSPDDATIRHETLHIMGFAHSKDGIMAPIGNNNAIEPELAHFIRNTFVKNPLAYLNILPLLMLFAFMLLVQSVFSELRRNLYKGGSIYK